MKRRPVTIGDNEIPGRFYPPGARKGNKGFMWRGYIKGREIEVACRTRENLPALIIEHARDSIRALIIVAHRKEMLEQSARHVVYFLAAGDEAIKIGTTRVMPRRLGALATGNHQQLRLLGTMPGNAETEKNLHIRFKHLWIQGEWFRPGSDLIQFIVASANAGEDNGLGSRGRRISNKEQQVADSGLIGLRD